MGRMMIAQAISNSPMGNSFIAALFYYKFIIAFCQGEVNREIHFPINEARSN